MSLIDWTDDGYPTEESLGRLQRALQDKDWAKVVEAFYGALRESRWPDLCGPERVEVRGEIMDVWAYHTGGWSGNEDILAALRGGSPWLWALALERFDLGGHYYFAPKERFLEHFLTDEGLALPS